MAIYSICVCLPYMLNTLVCETVVRLPYMSYQKFSFTCTATVQDNAFTCTADRQPNKFYGGSYLLQSSENSYTFAFRRFLLFCFSIMKPLEINSSFAFLNADILDIRIHLDRGKVNSLFPPDSKSIYV